MVTTWLAIVGTAKVMTALGTLMRSNRKRSFSSTTISSAHLGLPEGQREVDPALGNRPLAQAEAVAKARVYMEFRLYSRLAHPHEALPHDAPGRDAVPVAHAGEGRRILPRPLAVSRVLHDDCGRLWKVVATEGGGTVGAEDGGHARSRRTSPQRIVLTRDAELISMGYRFRSGSDCEILLPMYREYGTDMFAMLDAEFALILYDAATGSFIAARDPLGIRPLYYGELPGGGTAFASEPGNLVGICERIMPFPPGCWWKDGEFHRYCDLTTVAEHSGDDEEAAARHIRELLIQAVDKRLDSDAPLGFLLSGGLDSSLVCSIASRLSPRPIRP